MQNKQEASRTIDEDKKAARESERLEGNNGWFCGASCPILLPG
jgi:hypothetical protein